MNLPEPRPARGCGRPFKACVVLFTLVLIALALLLMYALRMPAMRSLLKCQQNMVAVGQALRRYEDVNGSYPPKLEAIAKDYLKDPSVLHCTLAKEPGAGTSYIYHRPSPDADSKFVVLECNLHKLKPDVPVSKLQLLKDGTVRAESPSMEEIIKGQQKRGARSRAPK